MFSHPEYDGHEEVVHAYDAASGLRAIVALHSTTLGPAFGGCRMYPYADEALALTDVLRLSRAQPGKLAYASSGNGSAQHLAGALFEQMAQVQLTHVPYRGGGPALNDVMGGQVPLFFANVASSLGHIQSGRLRALAVTSKLRSRVLPDVPSLDEAGLKGYEVLEWNPVLAPAAVPAPVRAKLAAAVRSAMSDPEVLARVRALG